MIQGYWLLQILCGQPILHGPYETDKDRESELQMCLIDPGCEYVVLIDPDGAGGPGKPHAWMPSWAYKKDLLDEPPASKPQWTRGRKRSGSWSDG